MKQDEQGKYIEFADFVKVIGLAQTGGQAKILIRAGVVLVDGKVETRLRRKLRHGMVVEHEGKKYSVDEAKLL
ncbi:MAG TPA: RNA-binding S4 domain-containing protein [Candidatus Nanoarchaeia archaeon]|nr:RNA-binding S4 domain-containing protein [Candidatus Nanoarchaeia archaeon]